VQLLAITAACAESLSRGGHKVVECGMRWGEFGGDVTLDGRERGESGRKAGQTKFG
jgi:hypothetical protein